MNDPLAGFPVVLEQDVIWGDMDAFGHVNNTVYFRYFEDARLAYFSRLGVLENVEQQKVGPILASTRCDFRRPLDYPDRIRIGARAELLSPRKFRMEYRVTSRDHAAIAAEGDGLIVYYDYARGRSCEIPRRIVEAMTDLGRKG